MKENLYITGTDSKGNKISPIYYDHLTWRNGVDLNVYLNDRLVAFIAEPALLVFNKVGTLNDSEARES